MEYNKINIDFTSCFRRAYKLASIEQLKLPTLTPKQLRNNVLSYTLNYFFESNNSLAGIPDSFS